MEGLNYTSTVSETVRELELEVRQIKHQQTEAVRAFKNKIQSLEEALNVLIASNSLSYNSSRLPSGVDTKLLLKGKTAPNPAKALALVRNLLSDNLKLDDELVQNIRSAELNGNDDILFDAGTILNKIQIQARSQNLTTENNGNVVIQNYN